jgi:hypothetical protein
MSYQINCGHLLKILLGRYFKQILKEQPYVVAGTMQRHEQTAKLALDEFLCYVSF